jgi:hypothetical protein
MKTEKEFSQIPNAHGTGLFWPVLVLLVATAIAIGWVAFPFTMKEPVNPQPLAAAQAGPDRYGVRLNAAEEKLNAWLKERTGIMDRIAQVEKSMTISIRRVRNEATALVEGVKRDMGQSFETIHAKITGIESQQVEAYEQLTHLQEDLAAARHDLDAMREANTQLAIHLRQIEMAQQSAQNQISGMQNRMLEGENKVDAMSYQLDRRRVDFELRENRSDEVTPGIHLTISRADVARQEVDGWIQIAGDGRFVWLHEAGAQRPVTFASQGDERTYHLVFTRVTPGAVTGYVLVPRTPLNTAGLRP